MFSWLNKLKPSHFFYQVFLGFWLTIASIFLMLLLFAQLQPEQFVVKPLKGKSLSSLKYTQRNLERLINKKNKSIEKVLRYAKVTEQKWLYLAHEDNELSLSSKPNNIGLDLSLLYSDTVSQPQFIKTEKYAALGPIAISLKGEQYQLFQIKPMREPVFLTRVKNLPFWLKAVAVLLPSIILSIVFSINLSGPLAQLSNSVRDFAKGKLDTRIPIAKKQNNEIVTLMTDFNHMAEQLEQNVTMHKQLLADVSHELRTPLTRLSLANALAQEKNHLEHCPYLSRVENEAHCLNKMLEDILTLSKLEYGQRSLNKHIVSIAELLSTTIDNARFEAKQHKVEILLEPYPVLNVSVDPNLINSAIENILRNAIKYAHSKVHISFEYTDTYYEVSLCDDGEGVSSEDLEKLSQPFYRASASRNRQSGGIGLGLAIAKKAVLAHHGQLTLYHNRPNGLCTKITLPR